MQRLNYFSSGSLRFKIVFGLLLSLLPMVVMVGITYYSSLDTAENSKRIMRLITQNGSKEINAFIKGQENVFSDWTKEDIFGMAIEFQTTAELQNHLDSLLKGQQGFSLLMLTNSEGEVLEAAVGEHIEGARSDAFKGLTIKEVSGHMNQARRRADLVKYNWLKRLGQKSAQTFVFSFGAKDSEGKPNGFFLAYVDWSRLQESVNAVFNATETNGFKTAKVAILDRVSGVALSHSKGEMIGKSLESIDSLKSWLSLGAENGEVRKFDLEKETDYVASFPIQGASGAFEENSLTHNDSNLSLTTFVHEGEVLSDVHRILWTSAAVAGSGAILVILVGLFVAARISKPLNRVIESLAASGDQVASASEQVSSSSHQLAEGTSEQAASLEETSSSLAEVNSMTRHNADGANQGDNLMKEVNEVVSEATESMIQLTTSMQEISTASEETSKIIKTIDEIAFQTNLLALNAAVEAARAGEAGAGFAVVADEVRNLAMRAADAAKDTAGLIEGTIKKVKDGVELVVRTDEAFGEVANRANKVGELVGEIAAASNDQAQSIEQVSTAVGEMDKVVQGAAAIAEESASASEEMSAQAKQMKGIVTDLAAIVGGNGKNGNENQKAFSSKTGFGIKRALAATWAKKARTEQMAILQADECNPEEEGQFRDF
ncbi:MAG: methyl-accepting chemotaxis protein [Thermodesulfobacteriota bacterium]|nr:methyl-accepting chemotaxis protein [Thermodesulfobacteriota bacterium]